MDPLQWMGAVSMRVQTANKNITIIHTATVHQSEPILPISRICKLRSAPETPGGPVALKDVLIFVLFLSLATGYENMNDHLF